MKKSGIISLAMASLLAIACNNPQKPGEQAAETSNGITFDTMRIEQEFKLDTLEEKSPALRVSMTLLVPQNAAPAVAKEMNACIANIAFGIEGQSPIAAADSTISLLKNDYYELRNAYINEKIADPEAPWFNAYYTLNCSAYEGRNGCICYITDCDIYSGGAHPSNITGWVNMSQETGKEIALHDVFAFNTDEALMNKIIEKLAAQHGVSTLEQLQEKGYFTYNDTYVSNNFLLSKDSIIFLYNQYEIAPYALGQSRIAIAYDELKELMKIEK